ncbi:MAG: class I SAM-dependent methyltransferase [Candidatus Pacebacteria bacterium]|nr:class I SAM-dependent methyltransferase [Candidatus Paceibacterota bacterium]
MSNPLDDHVKAYQGNSIYDFDNQILLNFYPQRIIHSTRPEFSVLDLGIGHGYTTDLLSQTYRSYSVIEGSEEVIANFKKNHPLSKATIHHQFFEDFLPTQSYDLIIMGFILEHVDDPQAIIRRYSQFLNRGGHIYIAVPNAESLNRNLGHKMGLLNDLMVLSDYDRLLGHKRYYTVKSLTADIVNSNCKLEAMEGIFLKPFTTGQLLSLNLPDSVITALCEVGIDYPELCCGMMAKISPA